VSLGFTPPWEVFCSKVGLRYGIGWVLGWIEKLAKQLFTSGEGLDTVNAEEVVYPLDRIYV
jgi:hypothetical protein